MRRIKEYEVAGKTFVFDGDSVRLYEDIGRIQKLKTNKTQQINSHRSNYLKTLCMVMNNSCNLFCEYCFANNGKYDNPNKQLSFENAKKAINYLMSSINKNLGKKSTIAFFGGEPLLSFTRIVEIVYYIENNFKEIDCEYMLTTNGTLFTEEIVKFLQDYNFDVMLSIDGTKEQHDYYRKDVKGKGSYSKILNGMTFFENKKNLNARITVTDINFNICDTVNSVLALGIERVTFAVDYSLSEKYYNMFLKSIDDLFDKYYYDIKGGKLYDITNISSVIIAVVFGQRKLAFCNAGISYLTLSADGKYYRCPRFVGNTSFGLGDVDDESGVTTSHMNFMLSLRNNPAQRNNVCNTCEYVFLCGGMCYHHAVTSGLSEFDNVSRECQQRRKIFDNTIKLICRLTTDERRKLLLYYNNLWKSNRRKHYGYRKQNSGTRFRFD